MMIPIFLLGESRTRFFGFYHTGHRDWTGFDHASAVLYDQGARAVVE
jgi:hypothetical protein